MSLPQPDDELGEPNAAERAMEAAPNSWTEPFHGVQHIGTTPPTGFWCTVADLGSAAVLLRWTPGCGFSPMRSLHYAAPNARAVAEDWLRTTLGPRGFRIER